MVTISKSMSANQIANYHEKDNYYMKDGVTEKGEWSGKTAEKLGLSGEVNKDDLIALANGFAPGDLSKEDIKTLEKSNKDGAELQSSLQKINSEISKDPENKELQAQKSEINEKIAKYNEERATFGKEKGQLVKDGKNEGISMHRAGIDMTFSAPKSVSVAALVGDDKEIIAAHQDAVKTALNHFEKNFSQTRVYNEVGERVKENTENLVIASYTHYTSRSVEGQAPDPQLHTHNVVFNMTQAQDGSYKSLSNEEFYNYQKMADQIYQNELANKLEKLGYQTEWQKQGSNYTFEIKGMEKANDIFSKRDGQIEEHLAKYEKELGRELTAEEKSVLKLETREYKGKESLPELKESWEQQLKENNIDLQDMKDKANLAEPDAKITNSVQQSIHMAISNLTATESTFNQHQIIQETAKTSQGRYSLDEIKDTYEKEFIKDLKDLKNSNDVAMLDKSKENQNTIIYANKSVMDAEKNIISTMNDGKGSMKEIYSKEDFEQKKSQIENFSKLNSGQAKAVEDVLTSKDLISGIQGDPGVGKTFLMDVLREVGGENVKFRGTSKTGVAVDGMQNLSKIDSKTIDSLLFTQNSYLMSDKPQIWLVDEASMAGTKQMNDLIEKAKKIGNTKIVLVGDTKQLKAVDAGDMFLKLQQEGMSTTIVDEILRQKTDLTKDIVKDFKNNATIKDGIEKLDKAGKLYQAPTIKDDKGNETKDIGALQDTLIKNVIADYKDDKKGLNNTTVLVTTNKEKNSINADLRAAAIEAGIVHKEGKTIETWQQKRLDVIDKQIATNYKEGDVLISNKMQGDIKSGTKTEVVGIDKEKNTLDIKYSVFHENRPEGEKFEERFKTIDATKANNFTAYEKVDKEFAKGDKIIFTKNDKDATREGIKNGEIGYIKDIDKEGNMTIISKEKGEFHLSLFNYKNIDHSYAITTHKAQGISEDNVHVLAQAKEGLNNHNAGFVQVSRAGREISMYTDDKEALIGKFEKDQVKTNASDFQDISKFSEVKDIDIILKNSALNKIGEHLEKGDVLKAEKNFVGIYLKHLEKENAVKRLPNNKYVANKNFSKNGEQHTKAKSKAFNYNYAMSKEFNLENVSDAFSRWFNKQTEISVKSFAKDYKRIHKDIYYSTQFKYHSRDVFGRAIEAVTMKAIAVGFAVAGATMHMASKAIVKIGAKILTTTLKGGGKLAVKAIKGLAHQIEKMDKNNIFIDKQKSFDEKIKDLQADKSFKNEELKADGHKDIDKTQDEEMKTIKEISQEQKEHSQNNTNIDNEKSFNDKVDDLKNDKNDDKDIDKTKDEQSQNKTDDDKNKSFDEKVNDIKNSNSKDDKDTNESISKDSEKEQESTKEETKEQETIKETENIKEQEEEKEL